MPRETDLGLAGIIIQVQRHSILFTPFPYHYAYTPSLSRHSIGPAHKRSRRVHSRGR